MGGMRRRRVNPNAPARPPRTLAEAVASGGPFESRAALNSGLVTRHSLATRFTTIVPGVYMKADAAPTQWQRITAVSMWAPDDAVICGWAAAHLHGEHWYSTETRHQRIDLYSDLAPRAPAMVCRRRNRRPIPAEDLVVVSDIRVTAPARTAVDVARWTRGHERVVCAIDSVCNATGTPVEAVAAAAGRMAGLHGVKRVLDALSDCDAHADSPQESLLRLRIARSSLPQPTSQLVIRDESGRKVATADLGYERERVAIFYDGHVHGGADQWRWDLRVNARLADLGWQVVRVTRGMSADESIRHIACARERADRRDRG